MNLRFSETILVSLLKKYPSISAVTGRDKLANIPNIELKLK